LEDNKFAGDEGAGNYGLRDQRRAMEWVHHFITDFGGDPGNITLFGSSTGAADILYHLHSSDNASYPLFQRAIIQSALIDPTVSIISAADASLSRVMSMFNVSSVEELRKVDVEKLVSVNYVRSPVDDGVFFDEGWRDILLADDHHFHHRREDTSLPVIEPYIAGCAPLTFASKAMHLFPHHLQPYPRIPHLQQSIMIGDCAYESILYSGAASNWTSSGVVRRIKAICQSLSKASGLLRAYDISPYTPEEELPERVLDLINDTRFAWPAECIVDAFRYSRAPAVSTTKVVTSNGNSIAAHSGGIWRYVFDQEAPKRGVPHHAVDILYLFDNARPTFSSSADPLAEVDLFPESFGDDDDDGSDDCASTPRSYESDEGDLWNVPSSTRGLIRACVTPYKTAGLRLHTERRRGGRTRCTCSGPRVKRANAAKISSTAVAAARLGALR